ncbi:MAG: hypothetical protein KKA19_04325, partial [Candidatus Margulisbacteria bacterium]|nr:hypothetical protein [Candidatus Margulisiibacteriota bacterium]
NITLKLAPNHRATSYLAAVNVTNSIMAGSAPIIGGIIADHFTASELALTLKWASPKYHLAINTFSLQHWDFLFILSFIIGFYSLHRLATIVEQGKITEKITVFMLLSEARRQMRTISPISGIRYMIQFPYALLIKLAKQSTRMIQRKK